MNRMKQVVAVAALACLCWPTDGDAENLSQNFEAWPRTGAHWNTTNNQWVANWGWIRGPGSTFGVYHHVRSGTNMCSLSDTNFVTTPTNFWLRTPLLTHGLGTMTFYASDARASTVNYFVLQTSTNDGADWQDRLTNSLAVTNYTRFDFVLNDYNSLYARICKTNATGAGSPQRYLSIDDVSVTNPAARVLFSDTGRSPLDVLANKPVIIQTTLTPSFYASNVVATCYWRTTVSSWTPIAMTNTDFPGNHWETLTAIPGQSAGENVSYSLTAWFQGNDPLSPTNDPPQGTNGPYSYSVGVAGAESGYDPYLTTILDDFPSSMSLYENYSWQGIYSTTTSLASPRFRISCVTTGTPVTNIFGELRSSDLPVSGTAVTNGTNITVSGTHTGQFVFQFNESNLQYSARQCLYQDFSSWLPTADFTTTTNDSWVASSAYVWSDPDRMANYFRIAELDSNGAAAVRSPILPDGIGEVSFYIRNWQTNAGPTPAKCYIQKSYTGSTNDADWITLTNIPSMAATNFVRRSFMFNDRYCNYVRVLNATNERICLANVLFANASAGVWFTNVVVNPSPPSAMDPVTLSCDVIPRAGASNRVVTAYYRSGTTTNTFTAIGMTNAGGDNYVTTNPVPAGMGDLGAGVGTVQYYFTCSFTGYESEYATPIRYPEAGGNASYTIIPAQVAFSNVVTIPPVPVVGSNVYIAADIIPVAAALYPQAWLYYRIGTNGAFTAFTMNASGTTNHYVTTNPIPAQWVSGTPVQYYITATFYGPMATTPTNYPAAGPDGPLSFVFRTLGYASSYTGVTVSGSYNTNLLQIGDYEWQAAATNTFTGPQFRFNAFWPSGNTNWGDANQTFFSMPSFGVAEGSAVSNIAISGSAPGSLLFRFNEATREYSIQQRCAYLDFDRWEEPDAGFGNYATNNWIITNGKTITNSPDPLRVFLQQGRSCVLNSNAAPTYVRTPYLTNGVGEINFWYRNWETNGYVPVSLEVQTSVDGTNLWRTISTVTNILTMDYLHFSCTLSDTNKHFVRIVSSTNIPRPYLCLDEIVIAEPGPGVTISNVAHSPLTPNMVDTVAVTADITPFGRATNLGAFVWYRPGTNGYFDSVPMTNTGLNHYQTVTPIPSGPVGRMEYFVQCGFTSFRTNETVYSYAPGDAPFAVFTYSNSETFFFQDFESWPRTGSYGTYTSAQWIASGAMIRGPGVSFGTYSHVHSGTNLCSINDNAATNWIQTPWLSNGLGKISFWLSNARPANSHYFVVQTSTNGTDWQDRTNDSISVTNYTKFEYTIDDTNGLFARFAKTSTTGGGSPVRYLNVDDLGVSTPASKVNITDVMIHPGYPASNENVYVSCTITSSTPRFPALNISARVRYSSDGNFTNPPVEMAKSGNYFITSPGSIPAFPERTTVEYYIESTFDGYCHDDSESYSPTYLPAGSPSGTTNQFYSAPTNYFSYEVRSFVSDYASISVAVSDTNASTTMEQLSDNTWQGIINFVGEVTDASFVFQGIDFYQGSNYWVDGTNQWGDANQTHSELPFSSIAQLDGPAVTNFGVSRGQYLLRFDEDDLSYTLQRCAYQDFDVWQASPVYYEYSINRVGLGARTETFDSWPKSTSTNIVEPFESWPSTNTDYNYNAAPGGDTIWWARGYFITNQVGLGKACQFEPTPRGGPVEGGWVRPGLLTLPDGLGTISFVYRCVDTNQPLTLCYQSASWSNCMLQATITPTDLPTNSSYSSFGLWSASMFARYADASNYYELRMFQPTNYTEYRCVSLHRCTNGVLSKLWSSQDIGAYFYSPDRSSPFTLSLYLSTYGPATNEVYLEGYINSTYYNNWRFQYWDQAPQTLLALPGAVGFSAKDTDIRVDDFVGGTAQAQAFNDWNNPSSTTIDTNGGWISTYGYIGNDYLRLYTNRPSVPPVPNIRSERLLQGIREIRFDGYGENVYPGWNQVLRVETSATGGTNAGEWAGIWSAPITNAAWRTYIISTNIASSVYVRLVNDYTNASGQAQRIFIDNMLISPNPSSSFTDSFTTAVSWTNSPDSQWYITNGSYNCRGYNSEPLTFQIQIAPTNTGTLVLDSEFTPWATFTNRVNTHYEVISNSIQKGDIQFVRVNHTGGFGSMVVDSFNVTSWHAQDYTNPSGWASYQGWITSTGAKVTNSVELLRSRAYTDIPQQYVLSPEMTAGVGVVSFYHRSDDGTPVTFDVQYAAGPKPISEGAWTTWTTVTNSSTNWNGASNYTAFVADNSNSVYVRVLHTTTNMNAGLWLDEVMISDFAPVDNWTWTAYNALITHAETDRLMPRDGNKKGAYLNKNASYGKNPALPDYTLDSPYIESPYMSNGIGEISFWYRNWGPPENPSTIRFKIAPGQNDPVTNWITIYTLSNVTNTTFQYFSFTTYDVSNHYVRVCNDTNTSPGLFCLDNLLVTEPYGADLKLRYLATEPEIPLQTNPVYVSVDIYDKFLQPFITNVIAYYHIGTNSWATWSGNAIPMTNVPLTDTWRTLAPIPAMGVDTVVQYTVRAYFDGLFADKASPKRYTGFANPAHYAPRNMNMERDPSGKTSTPYYVVFSCPPGGVWFNEVNNYWEAFSDTNEYIELCGPSDTRIYNWQIQLFDGSSNNLYSNCVITNITTFVHNTTNGFGFFVWGDPAVMNVDIPFNPDITDNLKNNGGARLIRSMGAYEYQIYWGSASPNYDGFTRIGAKTGTRKSSLSLEGTGVTYSAFTWRQRSTSGTNSYYSPGMVDNFQSLVGELVELPVNVVIEIANYWVTSASNWIVLNVTNDIVPYAPVSIQPAAWYSTNLVQGTWSLVTNSSFAPVGPSGVYTQWFARQTNTAYYFYRVTNSP